MNLLPIELQLPENNIYNFRQYQYNNIKQMLLDSFFYLKQFGLKFENDKLEISFSSDNNYNSKHLFESLIIKINLDKNDKKTLFFMSAMPKLMSKNFFILNGSLYCPQLYIIDNPINVNKHIIFFNSLYQKINISVSTSTILFLKEKLHLYRFLRVFFTDLEIKRLNKIFDFEILNESKLKSITILNDFFQIKTYSSTKNLLKQLQTKLNMYFFDTWTIELYKKIYNIDNIKDMLLLGFTIFNKFKKNPNDDMFCFINLNYKRLIFIEALFLPYFYLIGNISKKLLQTTDINTSVKNLKFINSHFNNHLDRENYYGIINGISSQLILKASFKSPQSKSIPSGIEYIHPSHEGKICPLTISNKKIGQLISLIPETNVDLKHGIFLD